MIVPESHSILVSTAQADAAVIALALCGGLAVAVAVALLAGLAALQRARRAAQHLENLCEAVAVLDRAARAAETRGTALATDAADRLEEQWRRTERATRDNASALQSVARQLAAERSAAADHYAQAGQIVRDIPSRVAEALAVLEAARDDRSEHILAAIERQTAAFAGMRDQSGALRASVEALAKNVTALRTEDQPELQRALGLISDDIGQLRHEQSREAETRDGVMDMRDSIRLVLSGITALTARVEEGAAALRRAEAQTGDLVSQVSAEAKAAIADGLANWQSPIFCELSAGLNRLAESAANAAEQGRAGDAAAERVRLAALAVQAAAERVRRPGIEDVTAVTAGCGALARAASELVADRDGARAIQPKLPSILAALRAGAADLQKAASALSGAAA